MSSLNSHHNELNNTHHYLGDSTENSMTLTNTVNKFNTTSNNSNSFNDLNFLNNLNLNTTMNTTTNSSNSYGPIMEGTHNAFLNQPQSNEFQALEEEISLIDLAIAKAKQRRDLQKILEFHEKSLFLRKKMYTVGSTEIHDAMLALVEACNYVATTLLQQNNLPVVIDLLKRALQVNPHNNLQRAITYNNLACYYRRVGKLRTALIYLEKAYVLESNSSNSLSGNLGNLNYNSGSGGLNFNKSDFNVTGGPGNKGAVGDISQTHLNLCATLSQLGRHEKALHHSQTAIIRVYELLTPMLCQLATQSQNQQSSNQNISTESQQEPSNVNLNAAVRERVSVLCIAYFNRGVEYEHLKQPSEALTSYQEGLKWAKQYLGDSHQIAKILESSSAEALNNIQNSGGSHGKKHHHNSTSLNNTTSGSAGGPMSMNNTQTSGYLNNQNHNESQQHQQRVRAASHGANSTNKNSHQKLPKLDANPSRRGQASNNPIHGTNFNSQQKQQQQSGQGKNHTNTTSNSHQAGSKTSNHSNQSNSNNNSKTSSNTKSNSKPSSTAQAFQEHRLVDEMPPATAQNLHELGGIDPNEAQIVNDDDELNKTIESINNGGPLIGNNDDTEATVIDDNQGNNNVDQDSETSGLAPAEQILVGAFNAAERLNSRAAASSNENNGTNQVETGPGTGPPESSTNAIDQVPEPSTTLDQPQPSMDQIQPSMDLTVGESTEINIVGEDISIENLNENENLNKSLNDSASYIEEFEEESPVKGE